MTTGRINQVTTEHIDATVMLINTETPIERSLEQSNGAAVQCEEHTSLTVNMSKEM